eukprot:351362-Chlamydomonas_euryale.AAC.7
MTIVNEMLCVTGSTAPDLPDFEVALTVPPELMPAVGSTHDFPATRLGTPAQSPHVWTVH